MMTSVMTDGGRSANPNRNSKTRPPGIHVREFPKICLHKIAGENSRELMYIASLISFPTINYRQQHKTSKIFRASTTNWPWAIKPAIVIKYL